MDRPLATAILDRLQAAQNVFYGGDSAELRGPRRSRIAQDDGAVRGQPQAATPVEMITVLSFRPFIPMGIGTQVEWAVRP